MCRIAMLLIIQCVFFASFYKWRLLVELLLNAQEKVRLFVCVQMHPPVGLLQYLWSINFLVPPEFVLCF